MSRLSMFIAGLQLACAAAVVVAAVYDVPWGVGLGIAALMGAYMWRRALEPGYRESKGFRVHLTVVAVGLVFALVTALELA